MYFTSGFITVYVSICHETQFYKFNFSFSSISQHWRFSITNIAQIITLVCTLFAWRSAKIKIISLKVDGNEKLGGSGRTW
jgi:hypothetical protein